MNASARRQAPSPSIAVVFLHARCNMQCPFCVTDPALSEMTFNQAMAVQQAAKARSIRSLVLGGGEPFTWPHDVVALSRTARANGFFVQVGTNGVALPEGFEHIPTIDRYVLPLESADARLHDIMRPLDGSHHALVLDRLDRLKRAGKPVTVSTVVTAQNISHLASVARFLTEYDGGTGRLHAWHLYKFIARGRGGGPNADRFSVTDTAYHGACDAVRATDLPFTVYKRPDMYHSKTVDFFWFEGDRLRVGSETWASQGAA